MSATIRSQRVADEPLQAEIERLQAENASLRRYHERVVEQLSLHIADGDPTAPATPLHDREPQVVLPPDPPRQLGASLRRRGNERREPIGAMTGTTELTSSRDSSPPAVWMADVDRRLDRIESTVSDLLRAIGR